MATFSSKILIQIFPDCLVHPLKDAASISAYVGRQSHVVLFIRW